MREGGESRAMTVITSIPANELKVGMRAEVTRLCLADDLYVFARSSGNLNPMHLPKEDGDGDGKPEAIAPSMWLGALISSVLGNQLPGPGSLYKSQSLRFKGRVHAGESVVVSVEVRSIAGDGTVTLDTRVDHENGTSIAEGEAEVIAPAAAKSFDIKDLPGLTVQRHQHFDRLLELAEPLPDIPTAVVAPEEVQSLGGVFLAAEATLIKPVLVGCATKIEETAKALGEPNHGFEVIDEPDHAKAAARAVALIGEGRARALMKGHLHTDLILKAVLKREAGLRTARRLSHVFVMDVPGLEHLLLVTDAAINIAPDLATKADIVQNAIDLASAIGIETPRAAILSAIETINPAIASTLDAAALAKMADRGQITGGIVDGPLAMDNAIDLGAARTKGIKGAVAGQANILVAPNLEAGNMLAKELTYLAHAEAGGIVLGAKVPVILTSRADDDTARLASCAVAALYAQALIE